MGDFPDLKRTSSRQKKRPNFFKAEPATLASAGDFAKPQPPPPKRKRRASKLLQSVEKKLKDEAGDTKLEFTKTPGPWETEVSRSCNHATDHSQGNGATELETEGLPASPPTSANEAIEEEGRTQPNKALPPAGCMDTSFSLQGADESRPLIGVSAAPAMAERGPLAIDPVVTTSSPAVFEHSLPTCLRELGKWPAAVSSQEAHLAQESRTNDGVTAEVALAGLGPLAYDTAVAATSQPGMQLSPSPPFELGTGLGGPATAASSQDVQFKAAQPGHRGLQLPAHAGLQASAPSKLDTGRKSTKSTVIGGGIGQIRLATSRPVVVNTAARSETVSGRSSPSDSHSDVDSIGNLETDSALELRTRQRTLERELLTLLAQLTRNRDSIMKATQHVIHGVELGLAQSYCRTVVEQIQKTSQRPTRPKCGPDTEAGILFRKLGAAALPHLVSAVSSDGEGLEKAKKVLNLWLERQLLPESVINPHLKLLKSMVAETQAHAKHVVTLPQGLASVTAELENQYGSMNTLPALQVASEGATPMSVHIHLKDDGEAWEDEVEEEEPNGDLHVENSPTLTGHATGYDAVPAEAPLPEDSPWHSGLSSPERGAQSSPVQGLGPSWQQAAHCSLAIFEPFEGGRARVGVSSIHEVPRLLYDTPSMEAVHPSSMVDIATKGILEADDDWDAPQLPPQELQAQAFGSLPPGLSSPLADTTEPTPNSDQNVIRSWSTLANGATGARQPPLPAGNQGSLWNLHGKIGEPNHPVLEPVLAGAFDEKQWSAWETYDRSDMKPQFSIEEQRAALDTPLGEPGERRQDARGRSILPPPLPSEQQLPGLEPLRARKSVEGRRTSGHSRGPPALPPPLIYEQQRTGLGPLLAGESGASSAADVNGNQWRQTMKDHEPARSLGVDASNWMAQSQVSTPQTNVAYGAGANEAAAMASSAQHLLPFQQRMGLATADVSGQSLEAGDDVHGLLRHSFVPTQHISIDASGLYGNTATTPYCAEGTDDLPPLPDEPPLPEEEAPPLPPDEPPQPPLPPEGDQLDDEVNPPVPESPPPLPPDDAQLGHVEMVQLAVSQTGAGGAEMEDIRMMYPRGYYAGHHVVEAEIVEGLLGPDALPLQGWTKEDSTHNFEQRQADSYNLVSQWGQHWEQPYSAALVTTYPSYPLTFSGVAPGEAV